MKANTGKSKGKVFVGVSGWAYQDWKGLIFPKGNEGSRSKRRTKGISDDLRYIAEIVDTIEINVSFYKIPSRRIVLGWLSRIEDLADFAFSAKLPSELTHVRKEDPAKRAALSFIESFYPLREKEKLAVVLAQFPYSFKYGSEGIEWIEKIREYLLPLDVPLAIEVRDSSWLRKDFVDFLKRRGLIFCNIDQPKLSANLPPTSIATVDVGYVRLHSRDSKSWFDFDALGEGRFDTRMKSRDRRYDYLYSIEELKEWSSRIKELSSKVDAVYVYFNNHPGGKSLINALQLKWLLGRSVKVPFYLARNLEGYLPEEYIHIRSDLISDQKGFAEDSTKRDGQLYLFEDFIY